MPRILTIQDELAIEICCACHMVFAMPATLKRSLLDGKTVTQRTFHCPAGHQQHYTGDRAEDVLRRERDRLKQQMARKDDEIRWERDAKDRARQEADHQRHRANGYKGHAARITKRAKAGVCPCCNRTFVALARHMATQHPEFTPEAPEPLRVIEGGKAA